MYGCTEHQRCQLQGRNCISYHQRGTYPPSSAEKKVPWRRRILDILLRSLTYSARPDFHRPLPVDELDGVAVDNASDNRPIADLPNGR